MITNCSQKQENSANIYYKETGKLSTRNLSPCYVSGEFSKMHVFHIMINAQ